MVSYRLLLNTKDLLKYNSYCIICTNNKNKYWFIKLSKYDTINNRIKNIDFKKYIKIVMDSVVGNMLHVGMKKDNQIYLDLACFSSCSHFYSFKIYFKIIYNKDITMDIA